MANKKYKLTDGNMWATDGIHDFGQNKTQRTINSEVNSALGGKAPTNHASTATTYGAASTSNYGHVKLSNTTPSMDGTAAVGDSTDVARANHVHPSDTSRVPTTRKINGMDLSQDRTLTSENIGYNSSTTYSSGTVGKAVSDLNGALVSVIGGKKVSIIGDSISTFNASGYKYDSYVTYYPTNNIPDVQTVEDTWWKKVLNASGATIEVNASYSGSRVTNTADGLPSFYDRCNTTILGNPDTIIVQLGTNDSNHEIEIGNTDFTTAYTSLDESKFATAYIKGIKALQALYPNAQILCVILYMSANYARCIQRIASMLGIKYIICGSYERQVGSHPNAHGMEQIASAVMQMSDWDYKGNNTRQVVLPSVVVENAAQYFVDENFEYGVAPSSDVASSFISFRDKTFTNLAFLRYYYTTTKDSKIHLQVANNASGSNVTNYLTLSVDGSGNRVVTIPDAAPWKTALGFSDTGWVDLSSYLSTYVTAREGRPPKVRLKDGVLYFHGEVYITTAQSGAGSVTILLGIPSQFRPTETFSASGVTYSEMKEYVMWLNTSGNVQVYLSDRSVQPNTAGFLMSTISGIYVLD